MVEMVSLCFVLIDSFSHPVNVKMQKVKTIVAVKPENKVFMLFNFLNSQLLTFFSPFGADALSPSPTRETLDGFLHRSA